MKKRIIGLTGLIIALGLTACGTNGKTPYIGENGNWWIGDSDLSIPAEGQDGKDGENGKDGSSVTVVSVEKTGTDGLVDTYTIIFSDGTRTTFTVTNGESNSIVSINLISSSGLTDTYQIIFSNGSTKTFTITNGKDGVDGRNLTVLSIELKSSEGLIDTYVINYSDGSKFEFVVSNGQDGKTPYIGDNGNWWIGDEDTGVLADWEKANNVPLTIYSNGLQYTTMTINNKTGYVVSGWTREYFSLYLKYDLIANGLTLSEAEDYIDELEDKKKNEHLVIPNYVGNIPVIGIGESSNLGFGKITLSRNTVYLGGEVFAGNENLREVDFNNCHITQIPYGGFRGTSVGNIVLPSSVNVIQDYAFQEVEMSDFDFSNIKYIGQLAFSNLKTPFVYLNKDVKYVGTRAFYSTKVYLEHETYPSDWPTEITTTNEWNGVVPTNCKTNGEYLYSVEDEEVTVYQYLGLNKRITIPSIINNMPVTKIGYGFGTPYNGNIEINNYKEIENYIYLEEVVLPEGVKEIGDFALCCIGVTIFAPSSLERISESFLYSLYDDDYLFPYFSINNEGIYAATNYLALAGSVMPQVIDGTSHSIEEWHSRAEIETSIYRIGFEINRTKVEDDEYFYYIDDGSSYSILSYKGLKGGSLTIPSYYNGKPVLSILRAAINYDTTLKNIKIENGITKIRPYGIYCYDVKYLYIPNSVSIINANGIYSENRSMVIYVYAASKPVDWDSNWTNVLSNVIYGMDGEININNFFVYMIKNNNVTLISYLGSSSNVYIPSSLDGNPVTIIKTGFYQRNGGADIYIPSSVTTIETNAFVNKSSKYFNIYCEIDDAAQGWNESWYFNTYRNDNSYYANKYWSQTEKFNYMFNNDYVYQYENGDVTLLAHCGNTNVVQVPRTIDNKSVSKISSYCFYFSTSINIYLPNNIQTIGELGIEFYNNNSSYQCNVYCEATSKPSNWNYNFVYNSYSSSNSYNISIYYNQQFGY